MRFPPGAVLCLLAVTGTAGLREAVGVSPSTRQDVSLRDYGLKPGNATHRELPRRLREISGLAMTDDQRLLAHHDEAGVVFEIDVRDGSIVKEFRLADLADPVADDFEGIAVASGSVYLVTSAGRLYECREGGDGESVLYEVHTTGVGRECEVEGLAYEPAERQLLLMCKGDPRGGSLERLAIHRWSIDAERLADDPPIVLRAPDIAGALGTHRFQPSGIERHPASGNYFVLAARQSAIAEVTPAGRVLSVRRLEAPWHRQLEGVTFAASGALIVADEGGRRRAPGRLTLYPGPERRE